jgi:hypothetical protein
MASARSLAALLNPPNSGEGKEKVFVKNIRLRSLRLSTSTGAVRRSLRLSCWIVAALGLARTECHAVPSFARQMNTQCIACHTEFPVLTEFGRQFKLSGYTMSADQTKLPPIAVMFQPSLTHTQGGQDGGAAPGFGNNNNYAMSQMSVFYSGRILGPYAASLFGTDIGSFLNKIGIFSQTTYDGVAKAWAWDNTDLRYADTASIGGHAATFGIYLNNTPTLQDPWNSTPAWNFPFSGSGLAPTPSVAPLLDGGVAGQVAGLGSYVMLDNHLYLDVAGYRTLSTRSQRALGVDPADETQIAGVAPYWRVAYTQPVGGATWEVGAFGLIARTYPRRDSSAGKDRITDIGIDTLFQRPDGKNDLTLMASVIHEHANRHASQALGDATNASDSLLQWKATVDYLWDKTYGFAAQYFNTLGTSDALAYGDSQTGSPNSNGVVLQANYLPINKQTGPSFWPRSNLKVSLQYVIYNRFDGSKVNIDGAGRSAKNNNTLYLEAWVVF